MENYRTEEEQVEALGRWWNDNGRSTVMAIIVALAAGFGWQAWTANQLSQQEQASDLYQALLRAVDSREPSVESPTGVDLAEQLKRDFSRTTYAQFAALHLAAMAVNDGKLTEAEAQLRWVLGKAVKGSDTARVAQLRLARVLASEGDTDQALAILQEAGPGAYGASYALAKGDMLLAAGRNDEARDAFSQALALAGDGELNLPALQQKLQSLTPVPARGSEVSVSAAPESTDGVPATNDTRDDSEE